MICWWLHMQTLCGNSYCLYIYYKLWLWLQINHWCSVVPLRMAKRSTDTLHTHKKKNYESLCINMKESIPNSYEFLFPVVHLWVHFSHLYTAAAVENVWIDVFFSFFFMTLQRRVTGASKGTIISLIIFPLKTYISFVRWTDVFILFIFYLCCFHFNLESSPSKIKPNGFLTASKWWE